MIATDALIKLGELCLKFGHVNRITYHPDGKQLESDTDHTVMLGLIACAFAHEYLSFLDIGLISQFALVHDLVETYAGDTPTLQINDEERADKAMREAIAFDQIKIEFQDSFPWLPMMIERYEQQDEAESRYVRALDKLLPKITHILNNGQTFDDQGVTLNEARNVYSKQFYDLQVYASDFPALFELRAELVSRVLIILSGRNGII